MIDGICKQENNGGGHRLFIHLVHKNWPAEISQRYKILGNLKMTIYWLGKYSPVPELNELCYVSWSWCEWVIMAIRRPELNIGDVIVAIVYVQRSAVNGGRYAYALDLVELSCQIVKNIPFKNWKISARFTPQKVHYCILVSYILEH